MKAKSMKSREACEEAYHAFYARSVGLEKVVLNADGTIAYGPDGKPVFESVAGSFTHSDFPGCTFLWYLGDSVLEEWVAEENPEAGLEADLFKGVFLRAPAGLVDRSGPAWKTPTGHRVYYFHDVPTDVLDEVHAWAQKIDISVTSIPTYGRWIVGIVFPHEPSGLTAWWLWATTWEPAARPWEWWPDWLKEHLRMRGFCE